MNFPAPGDLVVPRDDAEETLLFDGIFPVGLSQPVAIWAPGTPGVVLKMKYGLLHDAPEFALVLAGGSVGYTFSDLIVKVNK